MAFKSLHEFTVTIERDVVETTTREENGQKITVESKAVKEVPYTIVLKELSRKEKQDVALFQSIQYNEAINKGLLPRLIMQQKAGKESGSPLSEEEDKNLNAMNARLQELANDYLDLSAKKDLPNPAEVEERKQKLIMEYMVLSRRVIDINAAYQTVYAHTAETYMQNKTLTWLVLFLTYVKDAPGAEPRPLFAGSTFDTKEQSWADLEETNDPVFMKAYEKLSTYWGLYYMGRASKSEDFVEYDEQEKKRLEYEEKMRQEAKKPQEAPKTENPPTPIPAPEPTGEPGPVLV